jgi:hypothetical protein
MTEILLKHQPTGQDAEGVTPELLRLKLCFSLFLFLSSFFSFSVSVMPF